MKELRFLWEALKEGIDFNRHNTKPKTFAPILSWLFIAWHPVTTLKEKRIRDVM
jgi:hypothetical protein